MPNKIKNTGILHRAYNARSIIVHRAVSQPLVRATDGTLWAAARTGDSLQTVNVYKSTDDGFSWQTILSDDFSNSNTAKTQQSGLNHNGSHLFLQLFESVDRIILYHTILDSGTTEYALEKWVINTATNALLESTPDRISLNQDFEAVTATYNDHMSFIVSTNFSDLYVDTYRPTNTDSSHQKSLGGTFFNVFDAKATYDGYVDIAVVHDAGSSYHIQYTRYNSGADLFSAATSIYSQGATRTISDVNIARDGHDSLLIAWAEETGTSPSIAVKFTVSNDGGTSWAAVESIDYSAGHSGFTDAPTGQLSARLSVLGGIGGYMLTYTRNNTNGVPKTYVRKLSTEDGNTYTLEDEQEIATQSAEATEHVAGARFFQPPATRLLDITDPGHIRVGFQVGQGNSTIQADTTPVRVAQELLSESAYPTTLSSDVGGYVIDPLSSNQILVTVQVLAGPTADVDYFALGVTGGTTDRYVAAFNRVGTEMRLLKYSPVESSHMNDRSAYSAPDEYVTKAVIAPTTYDLPVAQGNETFTSYIERDIRSMHLPPDFHLERELILNRGNFLKRTVWTVFFDGNEYELTQVVPYFLNNEICYYSANAYVIGPSRNPFSRTILPSET